MNKGCKSKWLPILLLVSVSSALLLPLPVRADDKTEDNPAHHAFPKPVILIDAGHGGIDGGTSHGDILEKNINLEIAQRLYMLLRSEGYRAILNRSGDYALSDENRWHASRSRHMRDLAQRERISEEVKTSIVVSLHVNWSKNKARKGPIVLHQDEGRSALLAACIQEPLNDLYHSSRKSEVGKPFYLLNHTEVPAVIVETGFISNEEDRSFLNSSQGKTKVAQAIESGIARYFFES
ncbi:N-acetylmuramoyl-L-alanine amidase [Paenibacillus yonginensis]|uniref:N-acetylmuramoyl-L-alanine amidase n=1 Tax=Paenibacillus yonginensis TaxID=1462996 RepID=A0A1B1MXH9_9BACL|nr:N-acetylmuramoyl-L-alanine amidase [Paenibacillus yonginensis]ANS73892.1 N-acetylmuramoyl-L-alanine amidase [Paenibacillus yonginensis]